MNRLSVSGLFILVIVFGCAFALIQKSPTLFQSSTAEPLPSASPSGAVWTFDEQFDIPRRVLTDYYVALSARQFKIAYSFWDNNGKSSGYENVEAYSARFPALSSAGVVFSGTGEIGEAEGFRYFKQPVTIRTNYTDGSPEKVFEAEYTLRQPVESKTDQSWRIYNVRYEQVQ